MNKIKIPLIEELRAVRQRFAAEQKLDVDRYAAMLRELARTSQAKYVSEPLLPPVEPSSDAGAID